MHILDCFFLSWVRDVRPILHGDLLHGERSCATTKTNTSETCRLGGPYVGQRISIDGDLLREGLACATTKTNTLQDQEANCERRRLQEQSGEASCECRCQEEIHVRLQKVTLMEKRFRRSCAEAVFIAIVAKAHYSNRLQVYRLCCRVFIAIRAKTH